MKDYLELGQIVNVKGLKGEVKVNSFAEKIDRFETLDEVFIKSKGDMQKYKIEKVGYAKNQVILKFESIDTIEQAEALRNSHILVDRKDLGDLPEGEYYIVDLIGLKVYTEDGEYLGIVDDIFQTGSNDVYDVKNDLGQSRLLPGIKEVIKEINLPDGKIIVNLIEGL